MTGNSPFSSTRRGIHSPTRIPVHSAYRRYRLAETHYWGQDCFKIAVHPANVAETNFGLRKGRFLAHRNRQEVKMSQKSDSL
jgi:hypothetical protein